MITLLCIGSGCSKPGSNNDAQKAGHRTFSSFDLQTKDGKTLAPGMLKFERASLSQVLAIYAELSGRSIILAGNLPELEITFVNQSPLSTVGALQALDTVLAARGVTTVALGTQFVKVVPAKEAHLEPGPIVELEPDQLPESDSFLIYFRKSKKVTPSQAVPVLSPFSKLANSIVAIAPPGSGKKPQRGGLSNLPISFGTDETIFILRDYSANVRRMLKALDELEQQ